MTGYIFDIVIILVFLFFGVRYIKTREFDDKKNIYTEESKKKAALITGIFFIIAAIINAVFAICKYKGIINYSSDNLLISMAPAIAIVVGVVIVMIIVYAVVLKKK